MICLWVQLSLRLVLFWATFRRYFHYGYNNSTASMHACTLSIQLHSITFGGYFTPLRFIWVFSTCMASVLMIPRLGNSFESLMSSHGSSCVGAGSTTALRRLKRGCILLAKVQGKDDAKGDLEESKNNFDDLLRTEKQNGGWQTWCQPFFFLLHV